MSTVPPERRPGRRGRPRVYGEPTAERHETFLAARRPAGGLIRAVAVLMDEPTGWRAYFCTDASAGAGDILESMADRFAPGTTFRDCKEVAGSGRQRVRFVWASVGALHPCLWPFAPTEAWSRQRPVDGPVDRSASPWNDPGHADERRTWRQESLGKGIHATLRAVASGEEIRATAERLPALAA